MKREQIKAALPLILFGVILVVLIVGLHQSKTTTSATSVHVGDRAPLTDLPVLGGGGATFTTRSWQGRPYILNFFASWCSDCKTEHEELMTLAASNMPMIGIISKDKGDKVAVYLDRAGNPFTAVATDDGHATLAWGLKSLPETFLIDAHGIIRWHYAGPLTDQVVSNELMPVWEEVEHGHE